jgi:hypothetical protein
VIKDARLTALLFKKILLRNPKKWKADSLILIRKRKVSQNLLRKAMGQKVFVFQS